MSTRTFSVIRVFSAAGDRRRGRLVAGGLSWPCWLGRGGLATRKREGDGGTPSGRFRVLGGWFRADRLPRPRSGIALRATRPGDGWCDDPRSPRYNRPVPLPFGPGHERLWRLDGLYDLVLDLSYNRGPILRGRGSAIFLHCTRSGPSPTQGCVAVDRSVLRRLLPRIGPDTVVEIVRP